MNGLTTEGIIFLSLAWGFIWILTGFCFYKVLRNNTRLDDMPEDENSGE